MPVHLAPGATSTGVRGCLGDYGITTSIALLGRVGKRGFQAGQHVQVQLHERHGQGHALPALDRYQLARKPQEFQLPHRRSLVPQGKSSKFVSVHILPTFGLQAETYNVYAVMLYWVLLVELYFLHFSCARTCTATCK